MSPMGHGTLGTVYHNLENNDSIYYIEAFPVLAIIVLSARGCMVGHGLMWSGSLSRPGDNLVNVKRQRSHDVGRHMLCLCKSSCLSPDIDTCITISSYHGNLQAKSDTMLVC